MKRVIRVGIILAGMIAVITLGSCKKKVIYSSAHPEFETQYFNLGTFSMEEYMNGEGKGQADSLIRHSFSFTNLGNTPFVILGFEPSCDCTTAEYELRPIEPGETSQVTVVYDPSHYGATAFYQTVELISNLEETITLEMEGEIR